MSARGVTAQELPENQDESVKGVVQNEILHGHVRPANALEEGEAPEAGAAVDAFTASLQSSNGGDSGEPVDEPVEEVEPEPEAPVEEPVNTADMLPDGALEAAFEEPAPADVVFVADGGIVAEGAEVAVEGEPAAPAEEDQDAAGAGE